MTNQVAISWPCTLSPRGLVETTISSYKIYLDRILTLLSTNIGQRPMLPSYGVDWGKALFETDGDARAAIENGIRSAINIWISNVELDSIDFNFDETSGIESVRVKVILPDRTTASLPISIATLNLNGNIKEYK